MNILIVHEVDWIKKVTYEIHHLSEIFSLMGNSVYVIDIPDPGKFSLDRKTREPVYNYHRIYQDATVTLLRTPIIPIKGLSRLSAYVISYRFIKKILKEEKIDVVLLYSVVNNAKSTIKACKELKIPIVHRTFDIIHDLIREKYLRKKVFEIEKNVYPQLDRVLVNTPYMKTWAEEFGAKSVDVVPQGIDPDIMKPLPTDTKLRDRLDLKENDRVVMYLGSIESFSGLDILIDRIPFILKHIPDFKLLVVGGGGHFKNAQQQVKKLHLDNKVVFTGFVPYTDVPKYCSFAELCVNTFRITPMTDSLSPLKIFDLLACAKPILATPLKGLLHDFPEEIGIMFYSDLENFDKKIISLIKEKELYKVGEKGREFVMKNFTWQKVAEIMISEFKIASSKISVGNTNY